jgi:UTP--glucose-1-phosphate uridylyltransferase
MPRKAVIPVAGFGTRMLPAAKAVPKELLPVLDRPTVQYVVEECADAGLDDVLLVTSRDKRAIEDHFDRNAELESRLAAGGKQGLLASINDLMARVKIHAVRQPEQRGLGDAVYHARRHVGEEPFVCLLGDTIFSSAGGAPSPATQLVHAFGELGTSIIGLEEVPPEKVSRYGIVGGQLIRDGLMRLDRLVEKPAPESAPSRFAIAARYLLTPAIFDCLARTPRGKGGEIQLTDALQLLLLREPVHDWLKTNILFASRDPAAWEALRPLLRELLAGD